jgi:hypothetical protein
MNLTASHLLLQTTFEEACEGTKKKPGSYNLFTQRPKKVVEKTYVRNINLLTQVYSLLLLYCCFTAALLLLLLRHRRRARRRASQPKALGGHACLIMDNRSSGLFRLSLYFPLCNLKYVM